jgi:hypothetical protein
MEPDTHRPARRAGLLLAALLLLSLPTLAPPGAAATECPEAACIGEPVALPCAQGDAEERAACIAAPLPEPVVSQALAAGLLCNYQAGFENPRPAPRQPGGTPLPPKVRALASVSCTCYERVETMPWGEVERAILFRIDGLAQVVAEPVNVLMHWDLFVSLWIPARETRPNDYHLHGSGQPVLEHWFRSINPTDPAASSEEVPAGRTYDGHSNAAAWLTSPPVDDPLYAPGSQRGSAAIGRHWQCSEENAVEEVRVPADVRASPGTTVEVAHSLFRHVAW